MSRRTERLGSVIRDEITRLLSLGRLKDPRIHELTTITGVKVSGDLSHAKVYFTVLGDEAAIAKTGEGLHAARGFIQRHLARNLSIRVIPTVSFEYDPSAAYGDHINQLLSGLPELSRGGDEELSEDSERDDSTDGHTPPATDEER